MFFSHASDVALGMVISFWSRLKYANNYLMDCRGMFSRHSGFPGDPWLWWVPDFFSIHNTKSKFPLRNSSTSTWQIGSVFVRRFMVPTWWIPLTLTLILSLAPPSCCSLCFFFLWNALINVGWIAMKFTDSHVPLRMNSGHLHHHRISTLNLCNTWPNASKFTDILISLSCNLYFACNVC